MHKEAFARTKKHFRISGKMLHEKTGISQNHISEFINGKRAASSELLDRLILAMEEIQPGARRYYSEVLGENSVQTSVQTKLVKSDPIALIDAMDNKQISELMFAIAAKLGNKSKNAGDVQSESDQLALTY